MTPGPGTRLLLHVNQRLWFSKSGAIQMLVLIKRRQRVTYRRDGCLVQIRETLIHRLQWIHWDDSPTETYPLQSPAFYGSTADDTRLAMGVMLLKLIQSNLSHHSVTGCSLI